MNFDTDLTAVVSSLSEKQRELLNLVSDGLTTKEAARILGVSPSAIEQRIGVLKGKFGVSSRKELERRCRQVEPGILNMAERSIVIEALTRPDEYLPTRAQTMPTVEREAHFAPPMSPEWKCPLGKKPRFYLGFTLGLLAGMVVGGLSATYAFPVILGFTRGSAEMFKEGLIVEMELSKQTRNIKMLPEGFESRLPNTIWRS